MLVIVPIPLLYALLSHGSLLPAADSSEKDYLSGHDSITRPGEKVQGLTVLHKKTDLTVFTEELYCHEGLEALSDQHESPTFVSVEEVWARLLYHFRETGPFVHHTNI